jgi:hypothetical protein
MKYLIKTVETIRVASEQEAKEVIEQAKKDKTYTLSKYSSEYKCTKAKGEVVDEWFRVTLTKEFNAEKEPDSYVNVSYEISNFPSVKAADVIDEDEEDNF